MKSSFRSIIRTCLASMPKVPGYADYQAENVFLTFDDAMKAKRLLKFLLPRGCHPASDRVACLASTVELSRAQVLDLDHLCRQLIRSLPPQHRQEKDQQRGRGAAIAESFDLGEFQWMAEWKSKVSRLLDQSSDTSRCLLHMTGPETEELELLLFNVVQAVLVMRRSQPAEEPSRPLRPATPPGLVSSHPFRIL